MDSPSSVPVFTLGVTADAALESGDRSRHVDDRRRPLTIPSSPTSWQVEHRPKPRTASLNSFALRPASPASAKAWMNPPGLHRPKPRVGISDATLSRGYISDHRYQIRS